MSSVTEQIAAVPLFAGLPEDDLRILCTGASARELGAGEVLFHQGDDGASAYVITAGEIEILKLVAGTEVTLATLGPGNVIGEMALLREMPRMATGRAREATSLLEIPKTSLDGLLDSSPVASRRLLAVVLDRWRANEAQLRQNEKMAQLGTLTAGLAHEMNNPAGAVVRGAGRLQASLATYAEAYVAATAGLDASRQAALDAAIGDVVTRAGTPVELDPITRSDQEDEIETWMTDLGVAGAWDLAPAAVELGYTAGELAELATPFAGSEAAAVRAVTVAGMTATLVREVEEGATRLAAIVRALKSYTHLDQAPVQTVDVTQGIDDTLLILRSKVRDLTVHRRYAGDLPRIEAYASELNQVWTNLIDNAADALAGDPQGTIVIRVDTTDRGGVVVEVEDNGPGIPADVRDRVFDAFFTTKPPGSGTGLGLDISRSIVITRHGGSIGVESVPGRTVFRVDLPPRPPA